MPSTSKSPPSPQSASERQTAVSGDAGGFFNIPTQLDGCRFIKVGSNKKPIELQWTTTNNYSLQELQQYITKNKRYGVLCGHNNLVVIDFDVRWLQDKVLPKLPPTLKVQSPGRKLIHAYFYVDDPISHKILDLQRNTLADIQGTGKQVIGPCSEFPAGTYRIVNDAPIARIKYDDIIAAFGEHWQSDKKAIARAGMETDDECRAIKKAIKIADILREYNIDTSRNPTDCPLHTSKGHRCFSYNDEVFNCYHCWEKGSIFHLVMALDNCSFVEAKKKLANRIGIDNQKKDDPLSDLETLNLATGLKNGVPPVEYKIKKLLRKGGLTIIGGAAASKKTLLAQVMALSLAKGYPFLSIFNTEESKVLYCDNENGEIVLLNRFKSLNEGMFEDKPEGLNDIELSIFSELKLDNKKHIETLNRAIERTGCDIIIFDSLVRFMQGEEDKASEYRKVFDNLKDLMEKGVSIIILHHHKKGSIKGMDALRGSSDIAASADIVLTMDAKGDFSDIEATKSRHYSIEDVKFSICLKAEDDKLSMEYRECADSDKDAITKCTEDMIEWINSMKQGETFRTKAAKEYLKEHGGHSKDAVDKARKNCLKDKIIGETETLGKYEVL